MSWRSFTLLALGFVLSIYKGAQATNHFYGVVASNSVSGGTYTCRTQTQWNQLAQQAKSHGFGAIRIVGFDCDALEMASAAAASSGLQVLAGIYSESGTISASSNQINNDVQTFRAAYSKYGAGRFVGLTVGNEVPDTPANIMAKVSEVKNYLKSVGVSTPVSTAHTWVEIRDNPTLCGGDFVGANAHAFYDGSVISSQAGDFLSNHVKVTLQATCPGKEIYITETGWPSRGPANGRAGASLTDEQTALSTINCAAKSDSGSVKIFAFEYDDQTWKSSANEQSFGIIGKSLPEAALDTC